MQPRYNKRWREIVRDPGRAACGILAIAELSGPASHDLVREALRGLGRMEHRGGALDATGDGAGLLLRPERSFFERFLLPGKSLAGQREPLIVGSVSFLHGERNIPQLTREIDLILRRLGLAPLGWRRVPIDPSALGPRAAEDAPLLFQVLVAKGHRREAHLFEVLHRAKIVIEAELPGLVTVASLAPATTIYKALATAEQFASFFLDFKDPDFVSRVVVGHRRYSTNTFSSWHLVQPFRHIAHNGEINTITANCRAIKNADSALRIGNTLMNHGSDSAQVDRVAEMLAANGVAGIHEALRRMMSPAWTEWSRDERERMFFEANRRALGTLGAWEGPAAIVATDGTILTAILDRMGLRPLRYMQTISGRVVVASEAGAVPLEAAEIARCGQLEPGGMIIADLEAGTLIPEDEANAWIIERTGLNFESLATVDLLPIEARSCASEISIRALNAFGWTRERIDHLHDTVRGCREPIIGMGNDRPLAIFSENRSRLSSFLHQIVAVVTNPPIDPLREGAAIDTTVYLGRSPRINRTSAYRSWPQFELLHPILTNEERSALVASQHAELRAHTLDATFEDTGKPRTLMRRIHELTEEALSVARAQTASLLILTDEAAGHGKRYPLPMLLLVSQVHQALAAAGLRRDVSIIAASGALHEGHDCAILLAYGATAVNPYALLHLARQTPDMAPDQAVGNAVAAILQTLRRVMSKMGITSLAGYRGSALFEAIGISSEVVEYFIPDTVSRLGGITMEEIYEDIIGRAAECDAIARDRNTSVYRREVVEALQRVARNGAAAGDYDRLVSLLEETPPVYLRDMIEWRTATQPLPIAGVADATEIVRTTIRGAAMSHGALHATAHRAIAAAFNRFGSMSNAGEGGEDERRNAGGSREADQSRIRQIASGRFGVDATYLINAREIEIKIGQGAKPGEGGHLPGAKVTEEIARIRKTRPGVDLISPPPHHDIYSIEDLAQLIRNLRELHPAAVISVKVPSVTGLGTIAVGIVKAGAELITVSGFEGGTGAASSGSIAHAGLPLERGISEAHHYLTLNGIRSSVRLRADGGIKDGTDIAKILALGADEVAIGTPLLVAESCVYCRGCSKGNCPVGIAIHDDDAQQQRFMRRRLQGAGVERAEGDGGYEEARDGVIRYLQCVAEHLRSILAQLGLSHPRDLVGRVDLLAQRITGNRRWDRLDLADLLHDFRTEGAITLRQAPKQGRRISRINQVILDAARDVLAGRSQRAQVSLDLTNSDHAVGSTLAGEIARKGGLAEGAVIEIAASGYAGQGFGFGASGGMRMKLAGYANDAVAEIMAAGARVVVTPPAAWRGEGRPHLVGNAAAYGATGGTLYVAGRAGQRFGVRNSGATLVCEGVGKYAFEYMTGGRGVVLGTCGVCIGSGMTGGELFLYDPAGQARQRLHPDIVALDDPGDDRATALRDILVDFFEETRSPIAREILERWEEARKAFCRAMPRGSAIA